MSTAPARHVHFTHTPEVIENYRKKCPALECALQKWGLGDGMVLQSFQFRITAPLRGDVSQDDCRTLPSLPFQDRIRDGFLQAFFANQTVQQLLTDAQRQIIVQVDASKVEYDVLSCQWTSLAPFDQLSTKGVTRAMDGTSRQSHVSCMEELLPCGVIIADEVRSLFLDTIHHRSDRGFSDSDDAPVEDIFAYGKLSRVQRRDVFTDTDRREFLYHVAWRLVAGGGEMNQYEDDFSIYRNAIRDMVRLCVTSLGVQSSRDAAVDGGEAAAAAAAVYSPEVLSHVYQVRAVGGWELFPRSDGMSPSNMNYCYVIVNPLQQTVLLWYHSY